MPKKQQFKTRSLAVAREREKAIGQGYTLL